VADRYLIGLMLPRMGIALAVTLAALVIERLLRLFDFVTGQGAALGPVLAMAVNLLPHYLGLALPAAFCIGVLGALRQLSSGNEIDALEGAGWSLRRIGLPFILCAAGLSVVSLGLFGYVQPYSRYAYYEVRHQVLTAGWNGRVEAGVFLDVGEGMTLAAERIGADGRNLYHVFLLREDERGETAITARRGVVVPDPQRGTLHLVMQNGRSLLPSGERLDFDRLRIAREFDMDNNPFRPRGDRERELTLGELWAGMTPDYGRERPGYAAEFHDRLVRAVSLIGIALLSVPLGVMRKRSQGWQRIALAVGILAVFDNLLKFTGGLSETGEVAPAVGFWGAAILFNGFALWLYVVSPGQGADTPLRRLLRGLDRRAPVPPRPAPPASRAERAR